MWPNVTAEFHSPLQAALPTGPPCPVLPSCPEQPQHHPSLAGAGATSRGPAPALLRQRSVELPCAEVRYLCGGCCCPGGRNAWLTPEGGAGSRARHASGLQQSSAIIWLGKKGLSSSSPSFKSINPTESHCVKIAASVAWERLYLRLIGDGVRGFASHG